jgi:hypothetical protein
MKKCQISLIVSTIFIFIASLYSACTADTNNISQEEKEVLVAAYLRLADLLKGVSGTMCEQLAQYNDYADKDTIMKNCEEINDIIIQLKASNELSETKRDEYNRRLNDITQRIINIAKTTQNAQLAQKIREVQQAMEREMKIVRNKNIKLNTIKKQAETAAQQAKRERDAAILAQQNAEKTLAIYQQQLIEAQSKPHTQPNIADQQRLQTLQAEVERAQRERDAAIAEQKRLEQSKKEMKKAIEIIEADKNEPKAATVANTAPDKNTNISTSKPENPHAIISIPQLKQQIQQNLGNISPERRSREEREQVRLLFANPSAEIIYTDNNTYSIDSYWDKLSLLGPYDIHITDLKTDNEGKITHIKIEETRLNK